MTNVSLVGFGRIGRDLFRQTLGDKDINIVSISDTADKKNLIYLLKYDSIYGKLNAEIHETETGIVVDGKEIIFNSWKDGDEADWDFKDIQIFVPGANDENIDFKSNVFSLGSNTANAVAPILKALNKDVGVERAFLTTVHGYSNSNRLADVAGEGFRLNRAAGENIIPSITKSSEVIVNVLPFLKNKIASSSMTVPIPDGSTVDLTIDIKKETTIEEINNLLKNYSENDLKNIIGITYDPIVSSDVVRSTFSGLIDGLATMGINNKKIKLIIWFDNGWGYAARIIDTIKRLGQEL